MKLSFVIPCYRSKKTIESVVNEIREAVINYEYEIVLVNDGSLDQTFIKIKELSSQYANVIGVNLLKNFGQGSALMAGFHYASGDIVVCLDDDGQTPANEVGKLLAKIEEGYDVVYASYEYKQHSAFRNWGSRVNSLMTEILLGKPKDLYLSSYCAMTRVVVDEILRYKGCYPYIGGLVLRSTRNICNVPVTHRAREIGESGYTFSKLIGLWMNGFTSFSVKPLRMANYFGCFSAFCGFVYAINIVFKYLLYNEAPMGWSSLMVVMLMLGGILLMVLGMMGEYIGRIYLCMNATPQYVVREVIGQERQNE